MGIDVGNKDGDRRYYEGTIEGGDTVYVLGRARATDPEDGVRGPEDLVIQPSESDDRFVISPLSESELLGRMRWQQLMLAVGGIVAVFGLLGLVSGLLSL